MNFDRSTNNFVFSLMEALEERVLFDGVPDAMLVLPTAETNQAPAIDVQQQQHADVDTPRQLVLIDAGVENHQALLQSILEENSDSILDVRVIDSSRDGVVQISAILDSSDQKFDAIHIISHGEDGQVQLGNSTLSDDNLALHADDIASWAGALTDDADLLFYGCNLAQTADGEAFISSLSGLTGADVAASDDLTGNAALGGDWDLEFATGDVNASYVLASARYFNVLDIEAGNEIWLDENADGIRDAGEADVPDGVTLQLFDVSNSVDPLLVGTTTTSGGQYLFNDANVAYTDGGVATGLRAATDYEIRMAATDFAAGGLLENHLATLLNAGADGTADSNATSVNGIPVIAFVTGVADSVDDSLDIGLMLPVDLELTKSVDTSTLGTTGMVTWTLNVSNNNAAVVGSATGVVIDDVIPSGQSVVGGSAVLTNGDSFDETTGHWTLGDALAPGETRTIEFTTQVGFGVSVGDYIDLELTSAIDSTSPLEGDTVELTYTLTNDAEGATVDATGLTVNDLLPTGLTYVSDSGGAGVFNDATGVWTVADLAPGQSATIVITATVDNGTTGAINIAAEVATATGNDIDSSAGNASASEDDDTQLAINVAGVATRDVTGNVFLDTNVDGTKDGGENGLQTVTVNLYDASGNLVATDVSDANGDYSFNNVTNGDLRLEFVDWSSDVGVTTADPATVNADTVSSIAFLTAGSGDAVANLAVYNAEDSARLITTCFVFTNHANSGDAAAIVAFNTDGTQMEVLATTADVGATNGLAQHTSSGSTFAAAFQKRASDVGPDGNDAIYRVDSAGNLTTFIELDDFFGADSVGEYSHGDGHTEATRGTVDFDTDADAYATVGKVSWGDIDISEDGQTLYAVNLADRSIYAIEIGTSTDPYNPTDYLAGDLRTIERFEILGDDATSPTNGGIGTNQLGINADANLRPFALEIRDGKIYVGMMNSAQYDAAGNEGNTTAADLKGYVFEFDIATSSFNQTPVLEFDLDYARGNSVYPTQAGASDWRTWTDSINDLGTTGFDAGSISVVGAQPWLTDIEFDSNGDLMIGLRDRVADQVGWDSPGPAGGSDTYSAFSSGDLLRASQTATGWELETLSDSLIQEHYDEEKYASHNETAQGGLAQLAGFESIYTTAMDPVQIRTGGVIGLNNATGEQGVAIELFGRPPSDAGLAYGKANGLGDLEYEGNLSIEIGNRVWIDADQDGQQDAGEASVAGVTLELFDVSDPLNPVSVGTTTTDANGEYYFNDGNVAYPDGTGIKALTDYEIHVQAAEFQSGGTLEGYRATLRDAQATLASGTENVSGGAEFDTTGNGNADTARTERIDVLGNNGLNSDGKLVQITSATGGTARVDVNGTVIFTYDDEGVAGSFDYVILDDRLDSDAQNQDTNSDDVVDGAVIAFTSGAEGSADHSLDIGVVQPIVDLQLEKFVDQPQAVVGDTVTFRIYLTNDGTNATVDARDVTVSDAMPTGLSYVAGSATSTHAGAFDISTGQWTLVDDLLIGDTAILTFEATVDAGTTGSVLVNSAQVNSFETLNGQVIDFDSTVANDDGDRSEDDEDDAVVFVGTPTSMKVVNNAQVLAADQTDIDSTPGNEDHDNSEDDESMAMFTLLTDGGDLPNGYATNDASNGPEHIINGLKLGATIDAESQGQPSADATGDGADEDGVTFNSPLVAGTNASMTVTASAAGYLNGWVDFDSNGSLDEIAVTHVNGTAVTAGTNVDDLLLNAGANTIRFDVPATADGNMAARFRLTEDAMGASRATTGLAPTGEVEDYVLGSIGDIVFFDNGAGVGTAADGLQNGTEAGIAGATVYLLDSAGTRLLDAAGNAITTTTAADGSYKFSGLPGGDYRVEFVAPSGYSLTVANAGDDTIDSDANATTGVTGIYTISANEYDQTVDAGVIVTPTDFGDLPDTYGTTSGSAAGAASHILDGTTYLGAGVDAEADGQPSADALGDDATDDEDGVVFTSPLVAGTSATVEVTASAAGFLNAWIDFDSNGTLDEVLVTHVDGVVLGTPTNINDFALTAGMTELRFDVPTTADGNMAARFRYTADAMGAARSPNSAAATGEVEDYILGSIGDYVFADTNNDGLQTAGETPVAGVTVYLLDAAGVRMTDAAGNLISTTTDAAGLYEFAGLPAGDYRVEFVAPAGTYIAKTNVGGNDAIDSDAGQADGKTTQSYTIGANTTIDSADAGLTTRDRGDLPTGFNVSVADGGPSHTLDGTTYLGASVDGEADAANTVDALGDDTAGSDDENGVTFVTPLTAGDNATVRVNASTAGFLNAWIDFNGNGVFNAGEQIATDLAVSAGDTDITVAVPSTATGAMAARFRFTSDDPSGALGPDGHWDNGEVEDYILGAIGNYVWEDNGAGTGTAADGIQDAGEPVVAGVTVYLLDGAGTRIQDADSNDVSTVTDASGMYEFAGLPAGNYQVEFVAPTNYSFTQANAGGNDAIDSDAIIATGITATTNISAGEIDDTLDAGVISFDYGDLVDGYGTTNAVTGARHVINGLTLGASVDAESDGQPAADALGDGADEDGVTFNSPLVAGTNASMTVTASAAGYLNAWIDFDSSGSLDEINVTHVNGVPVTVATNVDDLLLNAGANLIRFDVPAGAEGNMAARFRLTADAMGATRATTGTALSGEVEDYVLGSIGNYVFLDADNDGVQDGGETPVAGVTVYLLDAAGVRMTDAAGDPISTTTDAAGLYEFAGLPAGDYRVEFVAPAGYALAKTNQGVDDAVDSDANQADGVTVQTYTVGANTTIDTADAGLTTRDRGDLPIGFNVSIADGGPSHTLDGVTYLGASVDAEDDAANSADASGDGADENGVTFMTPLTAGDNATVRVNASTAGFLNAWIDFNSNDTFDAGEQIATNLALVAGDNNITVAVPSTANGAMAARFRFTSDNPAVTTPGTPLGPDGHWDNGEVEDYILGAIGNYVWEDNGAGASGVAADGIQDASEPLVAGVTVYLLDGTGTRSQDADGNDVSTTTDASGLYEFAGLPAGDYRVEFVAPTNYSFTRANAGGNDAVDSDANIATGITATTNLTPGEVDDSLDAGLVRFDYGDLDDSYGTTNAATGARHVLDGTTFLGASVDAESDGQPSAAATDDGADEDGIVFTSPLTAGASATLDVTASAAGFLNAWIDFDSNGTLDEVLVTHVDGVALGTPTNIDDLAMTVGTTELRFDVPATAEGNMAARFRYTADAMGAGRSTTGTALSGEVEDYVLGSIGDYVFADANNDGLQTAGETPVGGVTVYLLDAVGTRISDAAGSPISTTTDAAGMYEFAGLPAGDYRVEFVAPAGMYIAKTNVGGDDAVDSDANQADGVTVQTYTVGANTTIDTADAGLTTRDRGDLPTGFNVSIADGGPSHTLDGTTVLGASVDSEADAANTTDATGDGADENGVTFLTPLSAGETALVRVVVNGAGDSYLSGWIDFNADGTLDQIDVLEINGSGAGAGTTLNQLAFSAGAYTLKIDVPTTATGAMAARFRLTADFVTAPGGLGVDGHVDSGEVEDYLLGAIGNYVWEDNGAGAGTAGDGVQDAGEPAIAGVPVYLLDGAGARIQNADGAFISTTTDVNGFYEFAGLPAGNYAVEFVAPTDYSFTADNAGSDDAVDSDANPANGQTAATNIAAGEIDNSLDAGLVRYDYGDLPDVYGTTNASAAGVARHVIDGVTFLGASVDAESDGQPAANATDDGVDEDGVVFTSPLVAGRPATVQVTASADGFLNAWIDFDSSGSLDEVLVTHVDGVALVTPTDINDLALLAGTTDLRFDVPATAEGTMAARFRYTSVAMGATRGTTGSAASGEVEDYVLGAIGDRVWRDNGLGLGGAAADGIQNGTEAGIADLRVYLLDAAGTRINDAAGDPIFTTTDATGLYEFAGLPAGDYKVEFVVVNAGDAFATTNAGADDAVDSDAAANGITPQTYMINAGTNDTSVDAGIVELEIGNRVWFDSDRDGLQETGENSVSGVTLDLFDVTDSLNPVLVGTAVTDLTGEYYFNSSNVAYPDSSIGLRPATDYEVRMRATDFASGGVLEGFNVTTQNAGVDNAIDSDAVGVDADGNGLDDGGLISLTTGAAGTLNYSYDIGLNSTGSIGDLVFVDIDGDNVLDVGDGDTGLGGVTVTLTYTDPILGGGPITLTTMTAIDGTYLFEGLPGDVTYKVTVDQNTLGAMHPDDIRQSSDPDAVLNGMSMVTLNTVGNGVTDDLDQDFGYVPLGVIGDTVWYDTDRDGVQDAGELGFLGVTLQLTSKDGFDLDPALAGVQSVITQMTDALGHYLFTELPAGDYAVQVISGIPAYYVQTGDPDATLDYMSMVTLNLSADVPPEVIGNMLQDFGVVQYDLGDLPDAYGTTFASGGAAHVIIGDTFLGTSVDGEADGQPNTTATGDGTDENGVVFTSPLVAGTAATIDVTANADGYLNAWIDFDSSGTLDEVFVTHVDGVALAVPMAINDLALTAGTTTLRFDVPATAEGNMAARFRYTEDAMGAARSTGGIWNNGEVEDYVLGSIGDKVFFDADNDGVQDAVELPAAGTTVYLLDAAGDRIADAAGVEISTTTDAAGMYEFAGLPAGNYRVEFIAPVGTDIAKQNQGDDALDSDANQTDGKTGTYSIGANTTIDTVDAGLTTRDRGDLPGGFNVSAADGGPSHTVDGVNYLGASVDGESDAANTADASGDGADENGVTFVTPLTAGDNATVRVNASAAGFLNAWIDFNGNGAFDGGEQIATNLAVAAGDNDITVAVPAAATGAMAARFRFTADDPSTTPAGLIGPDGHWNNGEVEDYILGAVGNYVWEDNGAGTGEAYDGIQNGSEPAVANVVVYLLDGAGNRIQDADGNDVSAMTNAIGFYQFAGLPAGDYAVEFVAPVGFEFTSPNEGVDDAVDSDAADSGANIGQTAAVNLTSGEIDDTLDAGLVEYDYGDLRDDYGTTNGSATGPAKHVLDGETFLGAGVDAEADGQPNAAATGDDTNADDEDGVVFLTPLMPGGSADIRVNASVDGYLNAWIDFNSDGMLDEVTVTAVNGAALPLPTNINDLALTAGDTTLTIDVPANADGNMAARFRFTADQMGLSRSSNSAWGNGEVEDYVLGSLGDFVFLDNGTGVGGTAKDGIQNGTEAGVGGVVVTLLDAAETPITDPAGSNITTTTAVDGTYKFVGLPAGDYKVQFGQPGSLILTDANQGVDDGLDSDADVATRITSQTYTIGANVMDVSVDAGLLEVDFGDLPDVYATRSTDDGARHALDGTTFLGSSVDGEGNGVPTVAATGDDVAGPTNDEDGVTFLTPLVPGRSATIQVEASAAGYLNAWIDFNSDGVLDEVTVTAIDGTPVTAVTIDDLELTAAGTYTLTIDVPANATGTMAARFRFTEDAMGTDRATTGLARTGEVEDYVLGSIGDKVFADANNDGLQTAGETPVAGVTAYLLDAAGVRLTDAAGDLISTVTDAAGMYEFAGLPTGDYRVEFVAPAGTYIAKPNQLTDDAVDSDAAPVGVTGSYTVGANTTIDTVDAGLTTRDRGDLPAGFNVSIAEGGPSHTLDGTTYLGASVDGEVDAANTANALGDDNDATDDEDGVVFTTPLVAGTAAAIEVTANTAGFLNAWVDFNGNGSFDGGEQIAADLLLAAGVNTVNVNVPADATGLMAVRFRFTSDDPSGAMTPDGHWDNGEVEDYLLNSIGDLVFEDDGDGIQEPGEPPRPGVAIYLKDGAGNRLQDASGNDISTVTDVNGQYEFAGLPDGSYAIEVVLPTDYGVSSQNAGTDDSLDSDIDPVMLMSDPVTVSGGETDDTLDVGLVQFDFGDLPTAYGDTTLADDGARHVVDGATFLGAGVDVDADGVHSADAMADDNVSDDEDGVVFLTPLAPGTSADVQVEAGSNGYLNGWIDFNSDGTLDEVAVTAVDGIALATPTTISDLNLTNGTHRLTIDIPTTATGTMAARFRFTSDAMGAARSTDGQWDNGEVEDYVLGSIGDRVFFDTGAGATGNGIQDAGENGVAGVNVYLLDAAGTRIQDAAGNDIVAVTNAGGLYEFPGLPAGDYKVEFELPAEHYFTVANRGGDEATDSDANLTTGITDETYTIIAGQANNDVDAGVLQAASLGDRVWFDINADGVQDTGEPGFENVDISIEVDIDGDGTTDFTQTTTTGTDGLYDFPSLPPGEVTVTMINPPAGYVGTFSADGGPSDIYNGALDPNQDRENVDFGLTGNSSLAGTVHEDGVDDATEPFFIDGVQDAGEPGIPNVTITLNGVTTGGLVFSKTTTTDGSGDYRFGDLPPGTYTIVETQPTSSPLTATSPNYVDGLDRQGSLSGTDPGNTLANDTLAGINLGINEGGVSYDFSEIPEARTDGYVFIDDNDNGIFDPGEQGIPGITVTLTGTDVFGDPVTEIATTDANGFYEFTGLYAGTYTLSETQPTNFNDGQEQNGSRPVLVSNDNFNNLPLTWGDNTFSYNFGEIRSDSTSGYPPTLPPLYFAPPVRISNFIPPGPGPIYTGDQIFTNSNPLSLDSGQPVAGGYSIDRGTQEDCDCECSCEEIIETPVCEEVVVPCDVQAAPFIGGFEPSILEQGDGDAGEFSEDAASEEVASEENGTEPASDDQAAEMESNNAKPPIPNHVLAKPSFLKRMSNWFVG